MRIVQAISFAVLSVLALGVSSATADPEDLKAYLKVAAQRIRNNYAPPPIGETFKAVAEFQLAKDGRISNIRVLQVPAKNGIPPKVAEMVVKFALTESSPLMRPPDELRCPTTVRITLEGTPAGKAFTAQASLPAKAIASDFAGYR